MNACCFPAFNSSYSASSNYCLEKTSTSILLSGVTSIALLALITLAAVGVLPHAGYLLPIFIIGFLISGIVLCVACKCRHSAKLEKEDLAEQFLADNIIFLQETASLALKTQRLNPEELKAKLEEFEKKLDRLNQLSDQLKQIHKAKWEESSIQINLDLATESFEALKKAIG